MVRLLLGATLSLAGCVTMDDEIFIGDDVFIDTAGRGELGGCLAAHPNLVRLSAETPSVPMVVSNPCEMPARIGEVFLDDPESAFVLDTALLAQVTIEAGESVTVPVSLGKQDAGRWEAQLDVREQARPDQVFLRVQIFGERP